MAFSLWLAFFGASVLLAIAPGPDNLFVLMQSAVFGVRAGMIVVLGLATGLLLQTLAAALGIAAVVAAVPALFWAIKCLGAAYLLWLAWQAWTHAKDAARGHDAVKLSGLALWRRGVVMNITNPKVQIFFLAFFPQFVPAGVTGWPLVLQMVIQVRWQIGSAAPGFKKYSTEPQPLFSWGWQGLRFSHKSMPQTRK